MPKEKIKKFKKKWIAIPVVVFVGVAAVCMITQNTGSKQPVGIPVSVSTAETQTLEEIISIKGTVQGSEKAQIQSTQSAEVKAVYVEEGDKVKKGQLLALLDSGNLNEEYSKSKIEADESKRKYEEAKVLYEQGAMARNEYLEAKATYESNVLTLGTYDFDKVNITSPVDGTVTRVNITVGSNANDTEKNSSMFVVENLENLQLKVNASEYDISRIKVGQTVNISAEMMGEETVSGVVSKIAPSGESKEGSSEMVIPVEIDINNEGNKLIAGVTARAKILIERKENILTVPVDAILEDVNEGASYVFVLNEGTVKKIRVETGIEGDFNIEIMSDEVKAGDQVVLAPTYELEDGTAVSVSNPNAI